MAGETTKVYRDKNGNRMVVAAGGEITHELGQFFLTKRVRVTAAEVNAGFTLVAAVAGFKPRLVDAALIAIGGAVTGATTIDILATLAAGSRKLLAVAIAALTQSTLVRAGAANATLLADGASFTANDENTPITIGKTGANMATATHVDVLLKFVLEAVN